MLIPEFPKTLVEFEAMFGTEEQCREYLVRQKWPDGFKCPKCGSTTAWVLKCRLLWVCTTCQHQVSITAGTACHKTRKPLKAWFWTVYLMTSSKRGLSAKELQRHLGCSYKTAWTWLVKLRAAMVNPDREPLKGHVETDECYIGGAEEGVSGRETEKKTVVICAVEAQDRGGTGRVRLGVLENAGGYAIKEFMEGKVEKGSVAHTDGWKGYSVLERSGYRHILTIVDGSGMEAHELLPSVHRVFSLIKRWILGTHQGSVSRKHLPTYLEEYAFRFNRRKAKSVTHGFQRLVEGIVREPCRPYWMIVGRQSPSQAVLRAA